jgi:predicted negative regulator of RcsB-dependent stress response
LQLAQQNLSSIGTEIVSLSQKYQQSHLYHLLGDYYAELKQTSLAKDAYAKALTICDNLSEQTIIQHKLMTID